MRAPPPWLLPLASPRATRTGPRLLCRACGKREKAHITSALVSKPPTSRQPSPHASPQPTPRTPLSESLPQPAERHMPFEAAGAAAGGGWGCGGERVDRVLPLVDSGLAGCADNGLLHHLVLVLCSRSLPLYIFPLCAPSVYACVYACGTWDVGVGVGVLRLVSWRLALARTPFLPPPAYQVD